MRTEFPSLEKLASRFRDASQTVEAVVEAAENNHNLSEMDAYVTWDGSRAKEVAAHVGGLMRSGYDAGPLMGIPCSVKDLYGVPGLPTFAGTDAPFEVERSQAGPVVGNVMAQMGIVMGKTHTVELAFGGIGLNAHWPTPQNPWSGGTRIPGGSSSGAGVSLCDGSALLALGTDTAGSVRIPASVTGNAGLKVTQGRWSSNGIMPLSSSFDSPGILCRTVEDLRYAFLAMDPDAGGIDLDIPVSGLRIGVLDGLAAEGVDDDIAQLLQSTLRVLEQQGAILGAANMTYDVAAIELFKQGGLAASELAAFLSANYPDRVSRLAPMVRSRVDAASGLSAVDYLLRKTEFERMSVETAVEMDHFDFLACTTVAISPPEVASLSDTGTYSQANMAVLRNTALANLLGLCAITLPIGLDRNGMPAGLMLMGRPYDEERLISAALAIENIIGTGAQILGQPPLN